MFQLAFGPGEMTNGSALQLTLAFCWVHGRSHIKSRTRLTRGVRFFVCLRDFGETARLWEQVPDQEWKLGALFSGLEAE